MTINLDFKTVTEDLARAKFLLATTESRVTSEICTMYIELCQQMVTGRVPDATERIMKTLEEKHHDNIDRPERHNIAGSMNGPSETQQLAFDKGK